jgi:hypothetical protein
MLKIARPAVLCLRQHTYDRAQSIFLQDSSDKSSKRVVYQSLAHRQNHGSGDGDPLGIVAWPPMPTEANFVIAGPLSAA